VIAPADDEVELAPAAQVKAWNDWLASGLQGQIEDDGESEFP
jgi:hypothetical protein